MKKKLTSLGQVVTSLGEEILFDDGEKEFQADPLPLADFVAGNQSSPTFNIPDDLTKIVIGMRRNTSSQPTLWPSASVFAQVTVEISIDGGPWVDCGGVSYTGGQLPHKSGGIAAASQGIVLIPAGINRRGRLQAVVSGGTCRTSFFAQTTLIPPQASGSYTTNFPVAENPVSEGGLWLGGDTHAILFGDAQAFPSNRCGASNFISASGALEDSLMIINPAMVDPGPDHFVRITIHRQAGYTPPSSHEIELLLRADATGKLYECLFPFGATNGVIVHQSGANPGWTYVNNVTGPGFHNGQRDLQHGDIVEARITGQGANIKIDVYTSAPDVNGGAFTLAMTVTDPRSLNDGTPLYINSGTPGAGFFARTETEPVNRKFYQAGNPVISSDGCDPRAFCISSFTCGPYP